MQNRNQTKKAIITDNYIRFNVPLHGRSGRRADPDHPSDMFAQTLRSNNNILSRGASEMVARHGCDFINVATDWRREETPWRYIGEETIMFAQVDPMTVGKNLMLIIGGMMLLSSLLFLGFFAWTGLNMLIFYVGKRRAEREHFRKTRRADGELFPPMIEGICEVCRRGGRKIYFPEIGKAMCPPCYERAWGNQEPEAAA